MDFNYHQKIDNLYFMNESVEHPCVAINDPTSQETKVMIDQNYNKMLQKTQIQSYLLEKTFPQTTLRNKMCPVSLKSNQFTHLGLYRYIYFIYFHVYLKIEESEDIPFKFYCSGNVNLFPSSAKT